MTQRKNSAPEVSYHSTCSLLSHVQLLWSRRVGCQRAKCQCHALHLANNFSRKKASKSRGQMLFEWQCAASLSLSLGAVFHWVLFQESSNPVPYNLSKLGLSVGCMKCVIEVKMSTLNSFLEPIKLFEELHAVLQLSSAFGMRFHRIFLWDKEFIKDLKCLFKN